MGSFNLSCCISRQTIAPRDPCMVMPIVQSRTWRPVAMNFRGQDSLQYGMAHSSSYPFRFWSPVGAFFEATYEDYGRVTLLDTAHNRTHLLEFLGSALRNTPVVSLGENETHELAFNLSAFMQETTPQLWAYLQSLDTRAQPADKPAEFSPQDVQSWSPDDQASFFALLFTQGVACWDHLWEVAQEQRMFWMDWEGILRPMSFSVMHHASFEGLVAVTNSSSRNGQSLEMRSYFSRQVQELLSSERVASLREQGTPAKDASNETRGEFFGRLFRVSSALRDMLDRVGRMEGSGYYAHKLDLDNVVEEHFLRSPFDEEAFFRALEPFLRARHVFHAMNALNLYLEPVISSDQDYSNSVGQAYARFVQDVSARVTEGRDVSLYGSPKRYELVVLRPDAAQALQAQASQCDTYIHVLRVLPAEKPLREGASPVYRAELESPLELQELQGVLREMLEQGYACDLEVESLRPFPAIS